MTLKVNHVVLRRFFSRSVADKSRTGHRHDDKKTPPVIKAETERRMPRGGLSDIFREKDRTTANTPLWAPQPTTANSGAFLRRHLVKQPNRWNKSHAAQVLQTAQARQTAAELGTVDFSFKVEHFKVRTGWDAYQYTMAVNRALEKNNVKEAVGLMEEARKKHLHVTAACHSVLTYFAKYGQAKKAFKFFVDMKRRGIAIDVSIYAAVLRALALGETANRFDESLRLLDEMEEKAIQRNQFVYRSVLTLCSLDGHGDKAAQLLREMIAADIEPKPADFMYPVQAYLHAGEDLKAISQALYAFNSITAKSNVFSSHLVRQLHLALSKVDKTDLKADPNHGALPLLENYVAKEMDYFSRRVIRNPELSSPKKQPPN